MLGYGKKPFLDRGNYFSRENYLHEPLKFDEIATSDRNLMIFGPKSIIFLLYCIFNNLMVLTRFLNVKRHKTNPFERRGTIPFDPGVLQSSQKDQNQQPKAERGTAYQIRLLTKIPVKRNAIKQNEERITLMRLG